MIKRILKKCPHQGSLGGVHTRHDPYGQRPKLGLEVYDFQHYCWACWKEFGSETSDEIRLETERAVKNSNICGFLEYWTGYCQKPKGKCSEHAAREMLVMR